MHEMSTSYILGVWALFGQPGEEVRKRKRCRRGAEELSQLLR